MQKDNLTFLVLLFDHNIFSFPGQVTQVVIGGTKKSVGNMVSYIDFNEVWLADIALGLPSLSLKSF